MSHYLLSKMHISSVFRLCININKFKISQLHEYTLFYYDVVLYL